MKKQKAERGEYGYLKQKKTGALVGTLGMVLIGLAIFAAGLLLNKMDVRNLFTVVAICMVIPAAKYLVAYVVLYPYRPMDEDTKKRLDSYATEGDTLLYNAVFTSSENVMHLDCIYITGHQIIGFTSRKKDNIQVMRDYLTNELKLRCLSYTVYIATEEKQVKDRMKLRGKEASDTNSKDREEVLSMLRTFIV